MQNTGHVDKDQEHPPGKWGVFSISLLAFQAASLVVLSPLLYYCPYALRGLGQYAFYEFGGYFLLHFITPGIGLIAALVLVMSQVFLKSRHRWTSYFVVLGMLALGFMLAGLLDTVPDFGE